MQVEDDSDASALEKSFEKLLETLLWREIMSYSAMMKEGEMNVSIAFPCQLKRVENRCLYQARFFVLLRLSVKTFHEEGMGQPILP